MVSTVGAGRYERGHVPARGPRNHELHSTYHRFKATRSVRYRVGSCRTSDSMRWIASFNRHVYTAHSAMLLQVSLNRDDRGSSVPRRRNASSLESKPPASLLLRDAGFCPGSGSACRIWAAARRNSSSARSYWHDAKLRRAWFTVSCAEDRCTTVTASADADPQSSLVGADDSDDFVELAASSSHVAWAC